MKMTEKILFNFTKERHRFLKLVSKLPVFSYYTLTKLSSNNKGAYNMVNYFLENGLTEIESKKTCGKQVRTYYKITEFGKKISKLN